MRKYKYLYGISVRIVSKHNLASAKIFASNSLTIRDYEEQKKIIVLFF